MESDKKPCKQCGTVRYIAPYARTAEVVICSRLCWEKYIRIIPIEEFKQLQP